MRRGPPLLAFLLATVAVWPAGASAATVRSCGNIAFEPNTDNGVSGIRARGVSCETARSVARRSRDRGPSGTPGTIFRYRYRRFRCVGRELDTALPAVRWRCTRSTAVVTFTKT